MRQRTIHPIVEFLLLHGRIFLCDRPVPVSGDNAALPGNMVGDVAWRIALAPQQAFGQCQCLNVEPFGQHFQRDVARYPGSPHA